MLDPHEVDQTTYVCNGAGCTGTLYKGYCWHRGALGQSCTSVCATRGGYSSGTRTVTGDQGTLADCGAVLNALGFPGPTFQGSSQTLGGLGCHHASSGFGNFWSWSPATTADAAFSAAERVCACEY